MGSVAGSVAGSPLGSAGGSSAGSDLDWSAGSVGAVVGSAGSTSSPASNFSSSSRVSGIGCRSGVGKRDSSISVVTNRYRFTPARDSPSSSSSSEIPETFPNRRIYRTPSWRVTESSPLAEMTSVSPPGPNSSGMKPRCAKDRIASLSATRSLSAFRLALNPSGLRTTSTIFRSSSAFFISFNFV